MNNKKKDSKNFFKRKELSYSPYIKGVKNEHGDLVIRPLTKEESAFLHKYNNEFVSGRFNHDDSDLHNELITSREQQVKLLKKESIQLKNKLKKLTINTGYRNLTAKEKIKYRSLKEKRDNLIGEIQKRRREIQDTLYDLDIVTQIDSSNYASRMDTMSYQGFRNFEYDCDNLLEYSDLDDHYNSEDFYPTEEGKELDLNKTKLGKSNNDTD